jgi:hypothetical protein
MDPTGASGAVEVRTAGCMMRYMLFGLVTGLWVSELDLECWESFHEFIATNHGRCVVTPMDR